MVNCFKADEYLFNFSKAPNSFIRASSLTLINHLVGSKKFPSIYNKNLNLTFNELT